MRCEQCGMPDGRHTSDCPVVAAAKQRPLRAEEQIVRDLGEWRADPDVRLIINAVCARHGVDHIAALDTEVLTDLHEAIALLREEAPPVTFIGDPRRTV